MQLTSVGEIFARRDLYILNDDEPDEEVVVLIGKPWPFSDLKDYYCPHQITGGGEEGVRYAGEVDAVQALQLAMGTIGAVLRLMNEKMNHKLRWLSDEDP